MTTEFFGHSTIFSITQSSYTPQHFLQKFPRISAHASTPVIIELIACVGVEGEVMLDGEPTPPNFQLISGYVVQDDVVMGTLTVRENLMFSANLRLSPNITQETKNQKVNRIISQLGQSIHSDSIQSS